MIIGSVYARYRLDSSWSWNISSLGRPTRRYSYILTRCSHFPLYIFMPNLMPVQNYIDATASHSLWQLMGSFGMLISMWLSKCWWQAILYITIGNMLYFVQLSEHNQQIWIQITIRIIWINIRCKCGKVGKIRWNGIKPNEENCLNSAIKSTTSS